MSGLPLRSSIAIRLAIVVTGKGKSAVTKLGGVVVCRNLLFHIHLLQRQLHAQEIARHDLVLVLLLRFMHSKFGTRALRTAASGRTSPNIHQRAVK